VTRDQWPELAAVVAVAHSCTNREPLIIDHSISHHSLSQLLAARLARFASPSSASTDSTISFEVIGSPL
jgi:hypothetical protein